MKFWLTQFKISAVLDTDSPSSQSKCRSALSEEDRHFAETIQILDRALSNRHPALERPSDLDFAIMNAVRTSHRPNSGSRAKRRFASRWLPAPAAAISLLLAFWWLSDRSRPLVHQPGKSQASISTIASTLEIGGKTARNLPPVVVAPLSEELGNINLDLEKAAQFLLTSLP